jgi:hypothetical protein
MIEDQMFRENLKLELLFLAAVRELSERKVKA